MAKIERHAEIIWDGNLVKGTGTIQLGSGATGTLPVTWPSRSERSDGKTSPEELIAAAHASCFAMAFSHALSMQGHIPERLTINATCTLEPIGELFTITTMALHVRGKVPGMDAIHFEEIAQKAKAGCAVSRAMQNNVTIQFQAELEA